MKNHHNHVEKIIIGGTLATDRAMQSMYGALASDAHSEIPARERMFALDAGGLGSLEDTYQDIKERVVDFKNRTGSDVVVGGHSQGAMHAMRMYLDGVTEHAVLYAGPHGGVRMDAGSTAIRALKLGLGVAKLPMGLDAKRLDKAPVVEDLDPESDYMLKYREEMEVGLHDDSDVRIVVATRDRIVPPRSALETGPDALKRIIVPHLGKTAVWRTSDIKPELRHHGRVISNPFPVNHITMTMAPASTRVINNMQVRANEQCRL